MADNAINETKIPLSRATMWHCRDLRDSWVAKVRGRACAGVNLAYMATQTDT